MNRGTAFKWIDRMGSGEYGFGTGQLRQDHDGRSLFCPLGVLLDFLNPNGWQRHPLHGWMFEGEVFKMPEEYRRRCKMKTEWCEFESDNGLRMTLVDVSDSCNSFLVPTYYVERYHAQF